jgi:hypothetical protein
MLHLLLELRILENGQILYLPIFITKLTKLTKLNIQDSGLPDLLQDYY